MAKNRNGTQDAVLKGATFEVTTSFGTPAVAGQINVTKQPQDAPPSDA